MARKRQERNDRLSKLSISYRDQLPMKVQAIEALGQLLREEGWSRKRAQALRALCQALEGTAATFGFPLVTDAAAAVQHLLQRLLTAGVEPGFTELGTLAALVASLRPAIEVLGPDSDAAGPATGLPSSPISTGASTAAPSVSGPVVLPPALELLFKPPASVSDVPRLWLNADTDAILLTDPAGDVLRFNSAASLLLGQLDRAGDRPSLVNLVVAESSRAAMQQAMATCLTAESDSAAGQRLNLLVLSAFGYPFEATVLIDRNSSGDSPYLVIRMSRLAPQAQINDLENMLNRKLLEIAHTDQNVRSAEHRRSTILDAAVDGIISFDEHCKILDFSAAAVRAFGISRDDAIGSDLIDTIIPLAERDTQRRQLSSWLERNRRKLPTELIELTVVRANESTFAVEVGVARVQLEGSPVFTAYLRDITHRKRIDQLKQHFLEALSHELNSPLMVILGSLERMAGGLVGQLPGPALEQVSMARSNIGGLFRMVNDILNLERLSAGILVLKWSPIAPLELMKTACQGLQVVAQAADVELRYQSDFNDEFMGDRSQLIQVLTHLIDNAIRSSHREGWVDICAQKVGEDQIRFSVADQGPGLAVQRVKMLFTTFSSLNDGRPFTPDGSGLGLIFARAMVELHGGTLEVTSLEGKGTVFSFVLPIENQDHALHNGYHRLLNRSAA